MEVVLQQMQNDNAELRKKLAESSSLEAAKRKADAKAEQLEQRASFLLSPRMLTRLN